MLTGILHTVAHLPLLALELLFHLRHRQGADSCTIIRDTLVLARGAAALYFHVVIISNAYNSQLIHSPHILKCS